MSFLVYGRLTASLYFSWFRHIAGTTAQSAENDRRYVARWLRRRRRHGARSCSIEMSWIVELNWFIMSVDNRQVALIPWKHWNIDKFNICDVIEINR